MSIGLMKPSFAAGELAPSLFGRVDLAKYAVGASTMRNMFVNLRGGAYSRAGTLFCGFSKQTGRSVPPRCVTFQFSINQGLALEFGNFYMRVLSNGAFVTEAATNITGITQANPGTVTDPGHTYANGDWMFLSGINGMTQLNGRTLVIANSNQVAGTYTLTDVYGNAIDTTAYSPYSSGGQAARVFTLETPWAEADTSFLKWTQSADTMSICCWNQKTGVEYSPYDLQRLADDSWVLTAFSAGVSIDAPASCSGYATVLSGGTASPLPTDYQYVMTAVSSTTSEESAASPIADIPNSADISLTAGSLVINCSPVDGAGYYNVYKAPPAYGATVPTGSLFGYIGTTYGTQFVDTNIIADFTQVPPIHKNPFPPGQIDQAVITNPGSGLTSVTYVINSATGTGAVGYPVIVGGQLVAFVFTDRGENYQNGDSITFNGAGFASGAISFGANPTAADTITLNGVVWTFVTARTAPNQTIIQGSLAVTIQQLAADLSSSGDPSLTVANYVAAAAAIDITYKTAGTGGNAYTLAASAGTPSHGTLQGGGGSGGSAPAATLIIGAENGTFPSTVAYFQQRRVYAGSPNNPDTYWMSQPGAFKNFDSRIPTVDSDAITGTPWSVQVNGIQFMVPMPGGLVILTGLEAWQLTGAGGSSLNPQPITPASQQAQPQAYNGCNDHIPPIKIDYDVNYVQAKGSLLRDLSYNFWANIYTGTDLTYLSPHLFLGHDLLEMAWCEEPYRLIWATRDDGILLSLSYFKQQDIMGWARHDTNGQYWSVCSVTEPPVDALYLASQRPLPAGNAYMIERMDNRIWAANENTWCVDAGLSTSLTEPNATLTASSSTGAGIPTGVTGLVGGQGYSAGTTAVIQDPTGTGANVALTIAAGVITGITITGGTGYIYPNLIITDPAGTGTGASATVTLDNSATFTASAPIFSGGMVGQTIRMGGGKAIITSVNGSNQVSANIVQPISQTYPNSGGIPEIAQPGAWSIAPNITKVSGLWHLVGATVTGIADGQPFAPQVVANDGTITLSTPASLITAGLAFLPQFQTLYLDAGDPTIQGRRGRLTAVTARLEASGVSSVLGGANQTDGSTVSPSRVEVPWGVLPQSPMTPLQLPANQNLPPYGSTVPPLWTGDVRVPIAGGYAKPKQAALQQTAPLPLQILALVPELLPGDMPEESASRAAGGGRGSPEAPNGQKMPDWGPGPASTRRVA